MTFDELVSKALEIFGQDAFVDEDASGELVIHTALKFEQDNSIELVDYYD